MTISYYETYYDLTLDEQCALKAANRRRLLDRLTALGLEITGAGWLAPVTRAAAAAMVREIEGTGHLDELTAQDADCLATDLARRFGL
jgi:hypothetical protein